MTMLNIPDIPIDDPSIEIYIQEVKENHQEEILQAEIQETIKKLLAKKEKEKILNGIREAVREVKKYQNGELPEEHFQDAYEFLEELKNENKVSS